MRINHALVGAVLWSLVIGGAAGANPTGLLIIPTADVLPSGAFTPQLQLTRANLPLGGGSDSVAQTQLGIGGGIEFGADTSLETDAGTLWNIKYSPGNGLRHGAAVAVGVQNIAPWLTSQPYVTAFGTVRGTRIHYGVISIGGRIRAMLGIDRALGRYGAFEADFTSGKENFSSVGAVFRIGSNFSISGGWLIESSAPGSSGYIVDLTASWNIW